MKIIFLTFINTATAKIESTPPVRSDFLKFPKENLLLNIFKFTQGSFDICCQSTDMAVLLIYKQTGTEPLTLKRTC